MDIFQNLSQVIDYIEGHLDTEISMKKISSLALCSEYHFRRMFPYITGISLSEYVRKRRLSAAALELSMSDVSIADIAVKYGYDSRISFSRAFKSFHNITPSQARKNGMILELYPRLVFHYISNGGLSMKYRVEDLQGFKLFGVPRVIKSTEDKHQILPLYAKEVMTNGSHNQTNDILGRNHGSSLHGIHYHKSDDTSMYMFGWEYDENYQLKDNMSILDVTPSKWAVFQGPIQCEDQDLFHDTWRRIYSEWFPNSNYQQCENPSIEKFFDGIFEIWIPIQEVTQNSKSRRP